MEILHLWKGIHPNSGGGGGVAMYRLHNALKKIGVQSTILCQDDDNIDDGVIHDAELKRYERYIKKISGKLGLNDIHKISSFRLLKHPAVIKADLLHIHGTHDEFISYLALPYLNKKKPIVFTLHDIWALTGHCGVSYECMKWKTGCGECPHLDAPPRVSRDMTRTEWQLKKWVYKHSHMHFVSPSTALTKMAAEGLLKNEDVITIPHGLDLGIYYPRDKQACRDVLNLPTDKKILMFSAVNTSNKHKGGNLLVEALRKLPEETREGLLLLVLGQGADAITESLGMETVSFGYVENDALKAVIYSAADAFVSPTYGEAFGLVLLEALACGTPAVSFPVGGVKDLVRDGVTGLMAKPADADDLREKIQQIISDDALRESLRHQTKSIVASEFDLKLQAQRHKALYESILST